MKSLGFLFFCLNLATSQVGNADDKKIERDKSAAFREIAEELRCPTCQSLSVLNSDAPFSEQIKTKVSEQLAAGMNPEEIKQYFVKRYGPWILREPPKTGFSLLAWLAPIILLAFIPLMIWALKKQALGRRRIKAKQTLTRQAYLEEFYARIEGN